MTRTVNRLKQTTEWDVIVIVELADLTALDAASRVIKQFY
jgi:hypothetical protein